MTENKLTRLYHCRFAMIFLLQKPEADFANKRSIAYTGGAMKTLPRLAGLSMSQVNLHAS